MPTHLAVTPRGFEFEVPDGGYLTQAECEQILVQCGVDPTKLRRRNGNLWAAMCKLAKVGAISFDAICTRCNEPVSVRGKCHHQDPNHGWARVVIRTQSTIEYFDDVMRADRRALKNGPVKEDYRLLVDVLMS